MNDELEPGDRVVKPNGYPFDGTVVAWFQKLNGDERVVVESEAIPGLLHIFAPDQLERVIEEGATDGQGG